MHLHIPIILSILCLGSMAALLDFYELPDFKGTVHSIDAKDLEPRACGMPPLTPCDLRKKSLTIQSPSRPPERHQSLLRPLHQNPRHLLLSPLPVRLSPHPFHHRRKTHQQQHQLTSPPDPPASPTPSKTSPKPPASCTSASTPPSRPSRRSGGPTSCAAPCASAARRATGCRWTSGRPGGGTWGCIGLM